MTDTTQLITVHPEDVPAFADDAEAEAWWATHDVEGPWEQRRPGDLPSPEQFRQQRESRRGPQRAQPVLVRLDADILDRLRAMADRKGTGYQTLLKRFITERLYEEEKLEGLFNDSIAGTRVDAAITGELMPLIEAGLIAAGDELFFRQPRRDVTHTAVVTATGGVIVRGKEFQAPSPALASSMGHGGGPTWKMLTHKPSGKTLASLREIAHQRGFSELE